MERGVIVRSLSSAEFTLVSVLLLSCSLIESPKEGTQPHTSGTTDPAHVAVVSEGNYLTSCREKDVPVPPDLHQNGSATAIFIQYY
jgi:hypothetical protein